MKPIKIYLPTDPSPIPYEDLWKTLKNDPDILLKDSLRFVGSGYVIIKQTFKMGDKILTRKSLVCFLEKDKYSFYPHEDTFPEGVEFYRSIYARYPYQFAPIMCLVNDRYGVIHSSKEKEKIYEYRRDNVLTEVFIAEVEGELPEDIFIADGHHRFLASGNDVLVAIIDVNDPSLVILPTHRILNINLSRFKRFLEGKSFKILILRELDDVERYIERIPLVLWCKGSRPIGLLVNKRNEDILMNVPAYISDFYLLEGRYEFIEGYKRSIYESIEIAEREGKLVLLLSSTRPLDVIRVAKAGKKMPRKSTDFYPKLIAGIIYAKTI